MSTEPCCTRCSRGDCRTTVCLDDDPRALCEACGEVTCDGCAHECEAVA